MGFEIIRSPYILYETVEMMYKFVNGISFRSMLSLRPDNGEGEQAVRRAEQLRANWWHLQKKGAWIQGYSIMGLDFSYDNGCPGDLLEQVCGLEQPPEFQLNLCRMLRNFDKSLDELAELIRPIARRLEETIRQADWILDEKVAYWKSSAVTPLDYVAETVGQDLTFGAEEHTTVAIFAMSHNFLLFKNSELTEGQNYLYIGCRPFCQRPSW